MGSTQALTRLGLSELAESWPLVRSSYHAQEQAESTGLA
jgi:lipoate synthase